MIAPLLTLAVFAALAHGAGATDSPQDVLKRAGAYVQDYHGRLSTVIAEEHYVQRTSAPLRAGSGTSSLAGANDEDQRRTLRAEFMLIRGVAGEDAWFAFRDVFEVDGRVVSSQRGRLEAWLAESRYGFMPRARALALEQARFNIGDLVRTINVPTLVLEFLVPENQKRFRFRATAATVIDGAPVTVFSYEERDRPTLIRTPQGKHVVARGAVWIESATGRVLRTELRTGERERDQARSNITVTYVFEPRLQLLVPASMEEHYLTRTGEIACTAKYSNFRRFETAARIIR
ncbi:MAG TPA: hypothetical protein VJ813_02325 [Vicinamibacterales bacterium]|nr:hypothetical protein [Vicinamibacterales bacterium]